MVRGRPKLDDNPYAYRCIIRNFINKYGKAAFVRFLALVTDLEFTKSEIERDLGIGFSVISRLHQIVFDPEELGQGVAAIRPEVREFLSDFCNIDIE